MSRIRTFSLFFSFMLLLQAALQAQESKEAFIVGLIRQNLSEKQNRQLDKANNFLTSADLLQEEANSLDLQIAQYEQQAKNARRRRDKRQAMRDVERLTKEAHQKRVRAARVYEKGFDQVYLVYKERLLELMEEKPAKASAAEKFMAEAKGNFTLARQKLNKLTDRDPYDYLKKELHQVHAMKVEGLGLMWQAFCEFFDCTPPDEKQDKPEDPIADKTEEKKPNDELVVMEDEPKNQPEENYATDQPESESRSQSSEFDYTQPDENLVVFKVQIIAVSRPLSETRLRTVYSGHAESVELHEGGLYKYAVGNFFTYDQAKEFRDLIGGDAFVIALKEGQKIPITEAIELSR